MNLVTKLPSLVNTTKFKVMYDVIMAFLAVSIIASLLLQNRSDLSDTEKRILDDINFSIWVIFVADYSVRLFFAKDKQKFIKENIIDLLSILPFDAAFQGLRTIRLVRVLYMFRVFIYLNRIYKRLCVILTTNNFHHVLWFTLSTILCGAIAISYIDDMEIGDALWWSFVTTTTVGYGDIAPASVGGRIIAVFLMIIGIGFLSTLTGTISTYFINSCSNQEKLNYRDEVLKQTIDRLSQFDDLSVEDINNIHKVLLALKNKRGIDPDGKV